MNLKWNLRELYKNNEEFYNEINYVKKLLYEVMNSNVDINDANDLLFLLNSEWHIKELANNILVYGSLMYYKNINDDGYTKTKTYKLTLKDEDLVLEAIINTIITSKGRHVAMKREIVSSKHIAFDHALAISYGIERLRNKIEYTDIVFNLMPEEFTLTELQQVYEVILDTELLKANFRRKIQDMVQETNNYTRDKGHRPSKLYRFNPHWIDLHIERRN